MEQAAQMASHQSQREEPEARSARRPKQGAPTRTDLDELGELIATVHASAYVHSGELVKLVERALKEDQQFTARLALRALRLEQALRDAQERLIHQQWEIAQCLRREQARLRALAPAEARAHTQ
jgi:hypothetical protein